MEDYKIFRERIRKMEVAMGLINKQGRCCGFNVSLAQCHALVEIGRAKKISLKELANMLKLDISTMSRTVDNLVKKELIVRNTSTTDRRSIEIELTDRGKTLFNDIENNMDNKYKEVFERISVEEKSKVLYSLKVVVDAFEESENSCSKDCCCHKSK